jgi:hypothetical protein
MQTAVQRVANVLAITNSVIGITGFLGPLVTRNHDRVINIRPGFLYGVFGMNWLHALLHLMVGLIGLPARRTSSSAINYMRLHAALFGVLAPMGVLKVRGSTQIHMMMGMALNMPANLVHILWAAIGILFARR